MPYKKWGCPSAHYGISIVRDRGIDPVALSMIESRHGTNGIVFVDGWTGKGAIAAELKKAINHRSGYERALLTVSLIQVAAPNYRHHMTTG